MEEIVQYVLDRLINREAKTLTLSSKENLSDSKKNRHYYINNKHLVIKDIGLILLKKIIEIDESDDVVSFIYQALDYDCQVTLQLSFNAPFLIDLKWLMDSPFTFLNYQKREYKCLNKSFITYSDVALLDSTIILVLFDQQRLTMLAREKLEQENIEFLERGRCE